MRITPVTSSASFMNNRQQQNRQKDFSELLARAMRQTNGVQK